MPNAAALSLLVCSTLVVTNALLAQAIRRKRDSSIARAVVNDPQIILADEPTGNLDPELSLEIMQLFERLHTRGATVLVATHDYNLVEQFGKKIIRLNRGKIIEG